MLLLMLMLMLMFIFIFIFIFSLFITRIYKQVYLNNGVLATFIFWNQIVPGSNYFFLHEPVAF